jgi:hypothetical protein
METNNYLVIYSAVCRSTGAQVDEIIWIHKPIKNTIINYIYWIEIKIDLHIITGRRKLILDFTTQKKKELKETKTFISNQWKY